MDVYHIVLYTPCSAALSAKPPSDYLAPVSDYLTPVSDYLTPIRGGNIEMKENATYENMRKESGQHVPPSSDSENVYDYTFNTTFVRWT